MLVYQRVTFSWLLVISLHSPLNKTYKVYHTISISYGLWQQSVPCQGIHKRKDVFGGPLPTAGWSFRLFRCVPLWFHSSARRSECNLCEAAIRSSILCKGISTTNIYIYIIYIYKHVRWPWLTPTQLRVSCVMNILTRNHMKPLQGEPAEHDSCKPIAKAANVIELRYKALCNIVHRHVALGRAETVEPRDDCHQETSTDPFSEHPKPSTIWRDGRNHAQQWGPHFYQAAKIEISPRARCKRDAFRSSQERFIAHRFHLTQQVLHMLLEKCESQ